MKIYINVLCNYYLLSLVQQGSFFLIIRGALSPSDNISAYLNFVVIVMSVVLLHIDSSYELIFFHLWVFPLVNLVIEISAHSTIITQISDLVALGTGL